MEDVLIRISKRRYVSAREYFLDSAATFGVFLEAQTLIKDGAAESRNKAELVRCD